MEKLKLEDKAKTQNKKDKMLKVISHLIEKFINEEEIFSGVDKNRLMHSISEMVDEMPAEYLAVHEGALEKRIKRIMALEVLSGILDDWNPGQKDDLKK